MTSMEIAERITQQGDRVTLSLTSWGRLGEAMADYDGHRVFVAGGIPGERVVAEVVKLHRKYVSAIVVEVLEASPDRVEPPCPYYGDCTGCQWQHLSYDSLKEILTSFRPGFEELPIFLHQNFCLV